MGFKLHAAKRPDLLYQIGTIAQTHFTIDTASPEDAVRWYHKNPYCLVVATREGEVWGYADFLPLTSEAKTLIEQNRLKEEEIGPDHILEPEAMPYCRAVYFAGIAVRQCRTLLDARCVAALLAGCADVITRFYSPDHLEYFYANPTTFSGNKLVRRLGLEAMRTHKTSTHGMDLYGMTMNEAGFQRMRDVAARYGRFVTDYGWAVDKE